TKCVFLCCCSARIKPHAASLTPQASSLAPTLYVIKRSVTRAVEPIHAHAAENLRFIRDAMSRASEFTALPGWGGVAMGATALVAAAVSGPPDNSLRWILVWLADASVAVAIGLAAIARTAPRASPPLPAAAPARRFALAYAPPLVAGMILTPVFASLDLAARL